MFKKRNSSNKMFQRRRNFLSRTAAVGGMALLGISAGPLAAAKTLTMDVPAASPDKKAIWPGNATLNDFSSLLGKHFSLGTEAGTTFDAKLIEASSAKTRHALRFRREHYSIVFDIPADIDLIQGQYRITHPHIGSMDLFMVPVDLPAKFNRLEAVFT